MTWPSSEVIEGSCTHLRHHTSLLNRVTGEINRILVECACCMMEHDGLLKIHRREAVMTAVFLRNRCPMRVVSHNKSPHQCWTCTNPLLASLKVFGCHAYVTVPREKRAKLDARSVRCRFLVYSDYKEDYRFWETEESSYARKLRWLVQWRCLQHWNSRLLSKR